MPFTHPYNCDCDQALLVVGKCSCACCLEELGNDPDAILEELRSVGYTTAPSHGGWAVYDAQGGFRGRACSINRIGVLFASLEVK